MDKNLKKIQLILVINVNPECKVIKLSLMQV